MLDENKAGWLAKCHIRFPLWFYNTYKISIRKISGYDAKSVKFDLYYETVIAIQRYWRATLYKIIVVKCTMGTRKKICIVRI